MVYLHYRVIGKHCEYASQILGIPNLLKSFCVSHLFVSSLQIFLFGRERERNPKGARSQVAGLDTGFFGFFGSIYGHLNDWQS
jgi:hypothetical protein